MGSSEFALYHSSVFIHGSKTKKRIKQKQDTQWVLLRCTLGRRGHTEWIELCRPNLEAWEFDTCVAHQNFSNRTSWHDWVPDLTEDCERYGNGGKGNGHLTQRCSQEKGGLSHLTPHRPKNIRRRPLHFTAGRLSACLLLESVISLFHGLKKELRFQCIS